MYYTTKGVSAKVKIGMVLFKKRIKRFLCEAAGFFIGPRRKVFFDAHPSPGDKKGCKSR